MTVKQPNTQHPDQVQKNREKQRQQKISECSHAADPDTITVIEDNDTNNLRIMASCIDCPAEEIVANQVNMITGSFEIDTIEWEAW